MSAYLTAGALLMLGFLALLAPAWHLLAGVDDRLHERQRLRRAARREWQRQFMDTHPVDRPGWVPYHRSAKS